MFAIPKEFSPALGSWGVSLHLRPWSERSDKAFDVLHRAPFHSIRVSIRPAKEERALRSVYQVPNPKRTQDLPPVGVRATGSTAEYSTFQYNYTSKQGRERSEPTWLGTYYFRLDESGRNIVVADPGEWSKAYTVSRQYNRCIDLQYQFPKGLPMNLWSELDAYVISKVAAFETTARERPPPR